MVTDAASARERVRLILDRANSPWLTNSEVNGFIEMSISEYIRERVSLFDSNQKIRDDFGKFVKSVTFSNEPMVEENEISLFRRQFLNYTDEGAYVVDTDMEHVYPGGEWGMTESSGVGCPIVDIPGEEDLPDDKLHFGPLLDIKVLVGNLLKVCKLMSMDDALSASKDPFNKPGTATLNREYHAVRVEYVYWITPGKTAASLQVAMTYISSDNNVDNISWLPTHGREEVCQIAARKIMGTVADERIAVADNEIKQLEGK